MHRIRHKHGRRLYLSDGIGGDSQSLLEREPLRSKDRGLISCNIDTENTMFYGAKVQISVVAADKNYLYELHIRQTLTESG